ncbi:MAG TPA: O-antigen ligase family protein [Verrucomicrobiae bacterium]|nr:O-antigen ligase family protein [Verrucomicrobiae bacterium]
MKRDLPPARGPLDGTKEVSESSGGFGVPHAYALAFGIFLGLALVKFGNPVILEGALSAPTTFQEWRGFPWPPGWSIWALAPMLVAGMALAAALKPRWTGISALWMLPVLWFAWQIVSAAESVDRKLSLATLGQFGGCIACYFAGSMLLRSRHLLNWLLIGLLAGFTFCLVRGVDQRLFEFPQERQMLIEGERTGWTNFAPNSLAQLKRDAVILTVDGKEVVNPFILAKYQKGRVHGTLVYPNAMAGAILLLWPVSIAASLAHTKKFKPVTRFTLLAFTLVLGLAGFFWTGSKFAWLIAIGIGCLCLGQLEVQRRHKVLLVSMIVLVGLLVFAFRFHNYFEMGARSAGARLDYWRAAVRGTVEQPWTGSGPGTFQRTYARLKAPESEMARLTHNDYLEQFSDSGIVGGMTYLGWISLALVGAWRQLGHKFERSRSPGKDLPTALTPSLSHRMGEGARRASEGSGVGVGEGRDESSFGRGCGFAALENSRDAVGTAVVLGLTGWFIQGLGEFSLYIPGLAWPAFTLLGWAVANYPACLFQRRAAGRD